MIDLYDNHTGARATFRMFNIGKRQNQIEF